MNIKIKIDAKDIKDLVKGFEVLEKHKKEITTDMANHFQRYVRGNVRKGRLFLKDNTQATKRIQGRSHKPLDFTGNMLKNLEATHSKTYSKVEFSDKKPEGSKISYAQIAALQEVGFRIPLQGDKGEKVRGFLAVHGIFPAVHRQYLTVEPRPFFKKSIELWQAGDFEKKIISKFWRKYV